LLQEKVTAHCIPGAES